MRERLAAVAVVVPFVIGTMSASADDGDVVFRFQDPAIVEASGLVVQDGLFVTTNDSGDTGRVFAVDPSNGRTVGVTSWPGEPEDVEALAPAGRDGVWVGDIGDNSKDRPSISVTRLPMAATDDEVPGETYELTYPGAAAGRRVAAGRPAVGPAAGGQQGHPGRHALRRAQAAERRRPEPDARARRHPRRSPPTARSSPTAATSCCATTAGRWSTATPGSRRSGSSTCPRSSRARRSPSTTTAGSTSRPKG